MPARARAPREFADLPYAHRLEPFTGELGREEDCESVHFEDCDFTDVEGGSSRFIESAFSSVTFTGGRYRRTRFNDVWMHNVRWIGTDLAETGWLDCEINGSLLAGLQIFGSQLRRVTFHHCKFDSANFRQAKLHDVSFVGCLLRDADFTGAAMTDVTFIGSTLDRVHFQNADMKRVDLRGAEALGIASGFDALRGATITQLQLLELAPALAQVLGLTVKDS